MLEFWPELFVMITFPALLLVCAVCIATAVLRAFRTGQWKECSRGANGFGYGDPFGFWCGIIWCSAYSSFCFLALGWLLISWW